MNILMDSLPETVTVDGREYFVDTDFRTFIRFEKILQDSTLGSRERVHRWIDLFFTEERPTDIVAAIDEVLKLYRCGAAPKKERTQQANGFIPIRPKQIYDFEFDAPYIFGAFLSQYGIDLNEIEYLHWWKFVALFQSLNSENKIVEIMSYRNTDLGKIENEKERARIAHLQQVYAIPVAMTREEKVAQAGAAFGGGFF